MEIKNSERLSFRLMDQNDAQLLFELDQDIEVMRYINGGEKTSMDDIKNAFIPRLNKFTDPEKGWGLWQVNVLETNQYIGWILVRAMNFFGAMLADKNTALENAALENVRHDNLELGWRFKQTSWGKGYATEAALTVKQALAATPNVNYFSAIADPNNQASINIMKKIGMDYANTVLHTSSSGDVDVVYYQCAS